MKRTSFDPDYRFFLDAMANREPARLPLYEHAIDPGFISKVIGRPMEELLGGSAPDKREYFRLFVDFWRDCGYDTVSFERGIPLSCPGSGALRLQTEPVLRSAEDVKNYPWDSLEDRYFADNAEYFELFTEELMKRGGMRAVGGPGYGIFETVQDLAGYTELCYMLADDPETVAELFARVTELYTRIWSRFLRDYAGGYCVCRMGDDLGFSGQTLLPPDFIRGTIIPGYKKIIGLVHASGRPFILHSCGRIFDVMDDLIAAGIDAKHSNEDNIAPFSEWVARYGGRICNLGGIDMNVLCGEKPDEIARRTRAVITESAGHGGFAVGCGNSIPDYVPAEGFFAMLGAANEYRERQAAGLK